MLSDRDRLARNLKEAREAKGISQSEAAVAVGKSRGTIANWEQIGGEFEPRSAELAILAKLYGIGAKDLRFAELERGVSVRSESTAALSSVQPATRRPASDLAAKNAAAKKGRKRA